MRHGLFAFALLIANLNVSLAQESPAKIIYEAWDAAYIKGPNGPPALAGYGVTRVREVQDAAGKKYLDSLFHLHLGVKRFDTAIQVDLDVGNLETPSGKVFGTFMKQYLGKNQATVVRGNVEKDVLRLSEVGKGDLKPAPWDDSAIGLFRQRLLFQDKNVKKGDQFAFNAFEPFINLVLTQDVTVHDYEEVEMFGSKLNKKLLRVEIKPRKIQDIQLPTLHVWLDETLMPVRSETEFSLGKMILYRTTKEAALSMGSVAPQIEIGLNQYVPIKQKINAPYQTSLASYRIRVREEDDPLTVFTQDARQKVKKVDKDAVEMTIQAGGVPQAKAGPEYLENCYFLACNDVKVKEHGRAAVGGQTDPWQKALLIEKYVKGKVKIANHEALATADHVARTLQGDCTECAMLMAAMCRAEGIPSRTAMGLIYADTAKGPAFAFHMWTEVYAKGTWLALDATLGQGYVGATHIKIADQSWHDERTMLPLLPVIRVLGKIEIDVLQTSR